MIEEFLAGEEATVAVMPPAKERNVYWTLAIVTRFNYMDGVAPWNGVVPLTAKSRVLLEKEYRRDASYEKATRECEGVARVLEVMAPIRIYIRRFRGGDGEIFALFDVNMKPVRRDFEVRGDLVRDSGESRISRELVGQEERIRIV